MQVYQLSINNFGANQLFQRHAIVALSRLLGMSIYCLKLSGQWRYAEHKTSSSITDDSNAPHVIDTGKQLRWCTIYLRELRFTNHTDKMDKNYRMLLPKDLWLQNRVDNMNISLRFSQFSDRDVFLKYQEKFFQVDFKEMIRTILNGAPRGSAQLASPAQRAFCVLMEKISLEQLTKPHVESSDENRSFGTLSSGALTSTLSKLFEANESSSDLTHLYSVLNSIVDKPRYFSPENVEMMFQRLISYSGATLLV